MQSTDGCHKIVPLIPIHLFSFLQARHRRQMKMATTRVRTASQYYGSSFCACTSDSLSRRQVFLLRYQRARSLAEMPQEPQKTDARSAGNHLRTEGKFATCCNIVRFPRSKKKKKRITFRAYAMLYKTQP
ncbi:unnamed protein product [Ixodes pacificus]